MDKKSKKVKQIEYKGIEKSIIERREIIKDFTYSLDDFSEKANPKNIGEHRSYVYALCEKVGDSLVPFYIGEGKGSRVWSHELETSEQIKLLEEELANEGRTEELEKRKSELSEKIQKINKIKESGSQIVKYIIKWGMTSKEAFMAESALINLLNIKGLKFDSSCIEKKDKLTNIVNGHQSEGEKQVFETKARTVEEFCEKYANEPLYFEDLQKKKVKALLININSAYPECLEYTRKEDREKAIKDTACGNWVMRKISELEKLGLEYVFATVQARIIGIYKIKEVAGKKFHNIYESVEENSEYPHGEGTVSSRNSDYKYAQFIVNVANSIGKKPGQLTLDDMPDDYKKEYIEKVERENKKQKSEKKKEPAKDFANSLKRKYMILENLSEDDLNYSEFSKYMYRRVIHTDDYVEIEKSKKKKELEEAIKAGKVKGLPNPDSVTNRIYGTGNPLKYIE